MSEFQFKFRVRYGECDAQGVVFNARYGDYVDLAVTEYLRAGLGGYGELVRMGFETQVVRLLTQWKTPARFDDVLCAEVAPTHFGNTSFTLSVAFTQANTGTLVATSEITYVLVTASNFEKTAIPEDLRMALQTRARGHVVNQSGQGA
ncbi:acyl-CoA thioesterase [Limnobacter sp.]|uniref:acyl-CoA thioesterase n=1 Tax=Limnobacter sp. TaxID=2003368 RepID=UPI00351868B7